MAAEEARTVFSAAHFVYIPLCVLTGLILGWVLGARSSKAEIARLERLLDTDDERRAKERLGARD
jgi:hypothetical protein